MNVRRRAVHDGSKVRHAHPRSVRAPLVAGIVLVAAFAGCVDDPVEPPATPPVEPPPDDPVEPDNLTGPAVAVEAIEGRVPLSAGTPIVTVSPTGNEEYVKSAVAPPNHTGIVVELAWTAKSGSESLQLTVEDFEKDPALDPPIATADGPSPLKVVVTPEQFAAGKLRMRVFASSKGSVAQDQPFTMYVSVFTGGPPGDAYTAVAPSSPA